MNETISMPSAPDAEKGVLSCLMFDPDMVDWAAAELAEDLFYVPANRRIFAVLCEMRAAGQAIDLVTVADRFDKAGELERVGGAAYLADVNGFAISSAHAGEYAAILRGKRLRRDLIACAQKTVADALGEDETPQRQLERAEQALFALHEKNDSAKRLKPAKEAIIERFEHWKELQRRHNEGAPAAEVQTGFKWLDNLTGGLTPGFWVIGARPSVGKTSLMMQLADSASKVGATAIFSMEMAAGQIIDRFYAMHGIEGQKFRVGNFTTQDFSAMAQRTQDVRDRPIYLDDRPNLTAGEICAMSRMLHRRHGKLAGVFVDYLQLCGSQNADERRDERLRLINASGALKTLSKQLECPVVTLAQLNRDGQKRGGRPRVSDVEGCGRIEQDADVMLLVWRDDAKLNDDTLNLPENSTPVDWTLAKQRNGGTGETTMAMEGRYFRFSEIGGSKW